jgi:DnaJ-domain-containing protein 1
MYRRKLLFSDKNNRDLRDVKIPKLDFEEDFYSVLEVEPTVDQKTLKRCYYKVVFKYHPDNKSGIEEKELCNRQVSLTLLFFLILLTQR